MRRIITKENSRVGAWIQSHGGGFYREGSQCIGLERDGVLIAGVLYDYYNGASIYMHVAAGIQNWLDREYLRVCFDYPFRQLDCNVVIGLVPENNYKARRFDEHLGFKLTATIPEGHPEGALFIYTMRKEQCRWIRNKDEQAQSPACA